MNAKIRPFQGNCLEFATASMGPLSAVDHRIHIMRKFLCLLVIMYGALPLFAEQKPLHIMPVGDSITEGGATFSNYRAPLLKKLRDAGAKVEYVGTRRSDSPLGPLAHEGYGGKDSRFLAQTVPGSFTKHPADIVLLHACHNHFAEKKPIPGIVADHEAMIAAFRKINPNVMVLVAQPITSAKLPKYSYLPPLGEALAQMAQRLHTEKQPVILVDQATGFDPQKDTIADLVHPNEQGAEKMAQRWFEALKPLVKP
jgi:hypothetical protein